MAETTWRLRVQRWRAVTGSAGCSILPVLLGMLPEITVVEPV